MVDLLDGAFYADDPHATWTRLRAEDPVHLDEEHDVWAITRYEDLRAVSKDPATWSSAGGIRPDFGPLPMMIDMDDPDHLRRRKLVNKGFTPKQVRDLEPAVRAACAEILDAVCERGECDLVGEVAALLPMIMIGDALGVAPEDRADLLRWSDEMVSGQSGTASEATILAAAQAFADYGDYIGGVIEDRRGCPAHDLVSTLVHAEVDGDRLDDLELLHETLLILVGGDETTRHVISGGVHALLTNPDQLDALRRDRSLLPTAVEECLRWVSPIKNMARQATRDVELRGKQIRAGQKVLLFYPSANRDEDVFADPFRFDVARTPNEHVAFGFGTHFCLGASLARLEVSIMLEQILDRLPDLELVEEGPIRPANFVSGHEALRVRFTPTPPVGAPA
jgi:cytochrome P450 family 142 subfamily A polypeptide 1